MLHPGSDPAFARIREPIHVVRTSTGLAVVPVGGQLPDAMVATLPAIWPEWLGGTAFTRAHGTRFAYVGGAMARGIASPRFVAALARAGCLAFYGAAGLPIRQVETDLDAIERALGGTGLPWGANLIHSPDAPGLEDALADLYLRRGVTRVSASAFMELSVAVVRYACTGLHALPDGSVARRNHLFAKISRPEVAQRFLSPAPRRLLDRLVDAGQLTAGEAALAERVPLAGDVVVEADSGGHTDNRPLVALFPTIARLRDEIAQAHGFSPARLGAAGGLGEPVSVAAAFALGADFVLTGSVNQASVESGLSPEGKALLAQAGVADVRMAPSADMFELGVEVQVLSRGTMFAARARKLRELWDRWPSLEAMPDPVREDLERRVLGASADAVWASTRAFFADRDPAQLARAEADPRHRMALVFRWYLGLSSQWAIAGEPARKADYQIWCGPAMGAFNAWVRGSFLEDPARRNAAQIAWNLLEGAAVLTRVHQLRGLGVALPPGAGTFHPRLLAA